MANVMLEILNGKQFIFGMRSDVPAFKSSFLYTSRAGKV